MLSILYFLIGVIGYSFIEYAVHRWVLHGPMRKHHSEHHRNPAKHVQTPFSVLIPGFLAVWWLVGPAMMLGMVACWAWSGALHWRLHVGNLHAPWVLKLRKHHIGHHRKAHANFGVSTVWWDKLLGTVDTNSLKR
jgi:sterol desaturase/sphingolipid hydroxylase (fatty acid hydroxylase superfamily)